MSLPNLAHRVLNRIPPTRAAIKRHQRRRGVEFYRQFLDPGDLCFDIGANVGNRTELFRKLGARVVAIEPQRACLTELERRFGADSEVAIVGKGLGSQPGTATLSISSADSTVSTLSDRWRCEGRFATSTKWDTSEEVEITTLDALVEQHGTPTFCKIDVEGFEAEVLAGLSRPLPVISFEFTREFSEDAHTCIDLLERLGPVETSFSVGESMRLGAPWETPTETFERLSTHPEPDLWGDVYIRVAAPLSS